MQRPRPVFLALLLAVGQGACKPGAGPDGAVPGDAVSVELVHEVPGRSLARFTLSMSTARLASWHRTRRPECAQAWNAVCWDEQRHEVRVSTDDLERVRRLVAALPWSNAAAVPAPGMEQLSVAVDFAGVLRRASATAGPADPDAPIRRLEALFSALSAQPFPSR